MATRIAHISDLHFPAKSVDQVTGLAASISEAAPDLVLLTGDLTRSGKKEEFQQSKVFLDSLSAPKFVMPGNHDIPIPGIFARLTAPFGRFESYFRDAPSFVETPDLILVGLNTAVGLQPGLDWSLGRILPDRLANAAHILATKRGERLGIVASHHPLHQHPLDPVRSRTFGGESAFKTLCGAGMGLLLHGHLHRSDCRCFPSAAGEVCEVCANTALANRERGGPAGYNLIDVQNGKWRLSVRRWTGDRYAAKA